MKNVVILGSTGSLGTQTVEVLKKFTEKLQVIGLCARKNADKLRKQAKSLGVKRENRILSSLDGANAVNNLAKLKGADIIINVLSGTAGIEPTKTALKANKILLLGNKESLIADGREIMELAQGRIIPLDSEHNAIYEILKQNPDKKIKKIILPCSGGPFFGRKDLSGITAKDALAHPKWNMGKKISIESATLLNKGLEIIEAHYLFKMPLSRIEVKIHPECLLHGLVEFEEKTVAYIAKPDMREHLENALLRAINKVPQRKIGETKQNEFTFLPPNHETFPGIKIVLKAFEKDKTKMREFLEKEEQVISKFLRGEISFIQIFESLDSFSQ